MLGALRALPDTTVKTAPSRARFPGRRASKRYNQMLPQTTTNDKTQTSEFPKDDIREAAAGYTSCGYAVCRPDPGKKRPTYGGWSVKSFDPNAFNPGDSIGIITGWMSPGAPDGAGHVTVCVDIDDPEAIPAALEILPPTPMRDGRPGKDDSHLWYRIPVETIPQEEIHNKPGTQCWDEAMRQGIHPG